MKKLTHADINKRVMAKILKTNQVQPTTALQSLKSAASEFKGRH